MHITNQGDGQAPNVQAKLVNDVVANNANNPVQAVRFLGADPLYLAGTPVITSPYLGVPSSYNAADLIINFSNINSDLLLLQEREAVEDAYISAGIAPIRSFTAISGAVIGQVEGTRPYQGSRTSDIDLPTATVDVIGAVNPYATGFMAFTYDNAPPSAETPPQQGPVTSNSHFYLDQGFITLGNLNKGDWYGTIGQFYVPFGQYTAYTLDTLVTNSLGQTKERGALVGFDHTTDHTALNVSAYVFPGDAITQQNEARINAGGANLDFTYTGDNWSIDLGSSAINDIADSQTMQLNGNATDNGYFAGFGASSDSEVLQRQVPALDLRSDLSIGPYALATEYIGSTSSFSRPDMTFNSAGAKPRAFVLQGTRSFTLINKPSSVSLGYGITQQSLALLLPEEVFSCAFNTSLWRDTVESIGYDHDINYGKNDTATGAGLNAVLPTAGLGHTSDTITSEIAVYF
jgi:hypothetical protein